MIAVSTILIVLLLVILTLASHVERLYSEMGKFLPGEFQENIDVYEQRVEPRLGMRRQWIAIAAAVWVRLSLAGLALLFGFLLDFENRGMQTAGAAEFGQAILGIILVIILFNQVIPMGLFTWTRGAWLVRIRWLLSGIFYTIIPIVLLLSFLASITEFVEPAEEAHEETKNGAGVDALLEAGQEEGIIEESDRDLIRSAVRFGDKVAREVMTPRPAVFAVPGEMPIPQFLEVLNQRPHSRVPVFDGLLDHITGIAFTRDLLQISDEDAASKTVANIQRPAVFVPETKRVSELLREMQREKQRMCIVIDEYGGVAGLVTIEDLLEEIAGDMGDEHEDQSAANAPMREAGGSWLIPGTYEVDHLPDLLGEEYGFDQDYRATTVGGLVSEISGTIPLPGEVMVAGPLRFEVVAATSRRIDRLRVSVIEATKP